MERAPVLEVALRRVVVGYRLVAVLWLSLLGAFLVARGAVETWLWLVTAAVAALWAGATVALRWRTGVLRSWAWIAADTGVSAAVIVGPTLVSGSDVFFYGGYPFSTVLLAAWIRGLPGALATALVLAAVSAWRLVVAGVTGGTSMVDTFVFYLAGSVILAWGMQVLRRYDAERQAAERALAEVRAQRALAEERAETAAHLHDSVLQTLALIQRRSDEGSEVVALARRQERELRDWLAGPAPGRETLTEALQAAAADVERTHRLEIEVVTVGNAPMDDALRAVVAAACEALVNVAKHARVGKVAVYAEVAPDEVAVFVRDRGSGFDLENVPGDRRGIRQSIHGRLERHGGSAAIMSTPGSGTEVVLRLPRSVS